MKLFALAASLFLLHVAAFPVNVQEVHMDAGLPAPWKKETLELDLPLQSEDDELYAEAVEQGQLHTPYPLASEPEIVPAPLEGDSSDDSTVAPAPEPVNPTEPTPENPQPAPVPAPVPAKPKLPLGDRIKIWVAKTRNSFSTKVKQATIIRHLKVIDMYKTRADKLAARISSLKVTHNLETPRDHIAEGAKLVSYMWEQFAESLIRLKVVKLEQLYLMEPHKAVFKSIWKDYKSHDKEFYKKLTEAEDDLKERRNDDVVEDISGLSDAAVHWSETLQNLRSLLAEIHEDVPTRPLNDNKFFKKLVQGSDKYLKEAETRKLTVETAIKKSAYKEQLVTFADFAVTSWTEFIDSLKAVQEQNLKYNQLDIEPTMERVVEAFKSVNSRFGKRLDAAYKLVLGQLPIKQKQQEAIKELTVLQEEWEVVSEKWGQLVVEYVASNTQHQDDEIIE